MKLKELHSLMQDMEPFEEPKVHLEQYPTGPDIASRMLYTVESMYQEFAGKVILDLGCGTAMLSVGAALLGAAHVFAVDVDQDALDVALRNCEQFEDHLPIDFVRCSIQQLAAQPRLRVDTVIMNPPFGTKQKGADMDFLRAACRMARTSVYSLHKSSTRSHIQKVALRELGCESAEVLAELRYDLPASYAFHKQTSLDIAVDFWRFELRQGAHESTRR